MTNKHIAASLASIGLLSFLGVATVNVWDVESKASSAVVLHADSAIVTSVNNNTVKTTTHYDGDTLDIPYELKPLHSSSVVMHGDVNMTGNISLSDVLYLFYYTHKGGPAPLYDSTANRELYIWSDPSGAHTRYIKYYR